MTVSPPRYRWRRAFATTVAAEHGRTRIPVQGRGRLGLHGRLVLRTLAHRRRRRLHHPRQGLPGPAELEDAQLPATLTAESEQRRATR